MIKSLRKSLRMNNLPEELISNIHKAKESVNQKLYKRFIKEDSIESRETIYSEAKALESVVFALIKTVRSENTIE